MEAHPNDVHASSLVIIIYPRPHSFSPRSGNGSSMDECALCALGATIRATIFHGCSRATSAPSTLPANMAARLFSHHFCECPSEGRR